MIQFRAPNAATRPPRRWLAVLFPIWAAGVIIGFGRLVDFSTAPGDADVPPVTWPAGSNLPPPAGRPVLVMSAHPRCPCTRASLGELARLVARLRDRIAVHVLVLQPAGVDEEWWKTDILASARSIPGVRVQVDPDGAESRRFGTRTSGHTLLYDSAGRLAFSGGITPGRGHAGDSPGRSAILAIVEGGPAPTESNPVFGCSLHDPRQPITRGGRS